MKEHFTRSAPEKGYISETFLPGTVKKSVSRIAVFGEFFLNVPSDLKSA
jgi:hypothetical protein